LTLITEIIAPYRIPILNALARRDDIDLHVLFLAETDPTQRQWQVYKGEIRFSYEILSGVRRRMRGQMLLLNWGVERALERSSPDAIVCGGYNYIASWIALRWSERKGLPFYLWVESTTRDLRTGQKWIEAMKRSFLSRCAGFIVPGEASRQYLTGYGMPAERIYFAPNAIDNDLFSNGADEARRNASSLRSELGVPSSYFLFVGRLVKEKGIFELLDAYSALSAKVRQEFGLVFVGDGPCRFELERMAQSAGDNIKVVGFAHREKLADYYGLADIFVFPTHTDPWGLVVNEAMACGLPVICSDAAGCSADLVEDGWNGRIVPASNSTLLAGAMGEFASDLEVRDRMGHNSRQRISQFAPEVWATGIASALSLSGWCVA
jgi:glycosyltransferase involved in cell wall biosynthesis